MTHNQQVREHVRAKPELCTDRRHDRQHMLTLADTMNTSAQRWGAAWATQRVNGVHGVANEWVIRPTSLHQQSGTQIARAALERFLWHQIKAMDTAEIEVEQSLMTLSGQTYSWAEREQAANAAWSAVGVTGVDNHIKVAAHTGSAR